MFWGFIIKSTAQTQPHMKNGSIIKISDAKELIKKKSGILKWQLGTAVEIYELEDSAAVTIDNISHLGIWHSNIKKAIPNMDGPSDPIEEYQAFLQDFPANKDSVLTDLSKKLKIKIDPLNRERKYQDEITNAVKKFPRKKVMDSLYLGLMVFLGETIINLKGGGWKIRSIDLRGKTFLEPVFVDTTGRPVEFLIKMIRDEMDNISTFDWNSIVIFWERIDKIGVSDVFPQ